MVNNQLDHGHNKNVIVPASTSILSREGLGYQGFPSFVRDPIYRTQRHTYNILQQFRFNGGLQPASYQYQFSDPSFQVSTPDYQNMFNQHFSTGLPTPSTIRQTNQFEFSHVLPTPSATWQTNQLARQEPKLNDIDVIPNNSVFEEVPLAPLESPAQEQNVQEPHVSAPLQPQRPFEPLFDFDTFSQLKKIEQKPVSQRNQLFANFNIGRHGNQVQSGRKGGINEDLLSQFQVFEAVPDEEF